MDRIIGCVLVVIMWFCAVQGAAAAAATGRVFTKFDVKAYSSPTFDSQQTEEIPAGAALDVLSDEAVWVKVKTPKGAEGWLARKWITADSEELVQLHNQREHQKQEKINDLETKAKATPDHFVYDKRNIYKDLLKLQPDNPEYRAQLKRYDEKIATLLNFRQTRWGMSKEQVLKTEKGAPSLTHSDLLVFPSRLGNKMVDIVYIFASNQLVRGKYILKESHTNKNDFIVDYNEWKLLLVKKYGPPKADEKVWKNHLLKDDSANEGLAIGTGGLVYFASWKTTPTNIAIILDGDNYQVQCTIEYTSNEYKPLEGSLNNSSEKITE